MIQTRALCGHDTIPVVGLVISTITAIATSGACRSGDAPRTEPSSVVLRVGVGPVSSTNPIFGLRQLSQLLYGEGLARLGTDGSLQPWLAEKWTLAHHGRSLVVTLRSAVTFHDGSPVTAETVAAVLPDALRSQTLGPVFEDIEYIKATTPTTIELGFRRPSPFLMESLEVQIRKPGAPTVGTGPFKVAPNSTTQLLANREYYLGPPKVDEVRIQTYPAVRTAWAELLRNGIDMLYDVGPDALDSLQSSTNIAVFTHVRHYQYLVALNTELPALRASALRRALNMAVDRQEFVRQALREHGVPSTTGIWPQYWALENRSPAVQFDPQQAAQILGSKHLRLTCLVPPDQMYERMALELKRQLAAVGVDMAVQTASHDQIYEAEKQRKYDAILTEAVSAPSLLRPYQLWHSGGAGNPGGLGSAGIDRAFDRVRYAENEADYKQAVGALRQAFIDDPPAIFLAWSERARAVSKRFDVPAPEQGRDILGTLRLWTPRIDQTIASRN